MYTDELLPLLAYQHLQRVSFEVQVAELYQGTSHFDDIYMELNALGFVFCGTFDQILGREGKVLFFDGLFIKPGVL